MNQPSSIESSQHEYKSPLMDESPPPYGASIEYIDPPEYRNESLFGVSNEIDSLITGRAPYCNLDSCEQVYNLTSTARRHRSKLSQVPSIMEAIKNTSGTHRQQRVVGLISVPAAIVHDVIAPPYHLVQMVIAVSRSKCERKRADAGILDEIMDSFFLSLEAAFKMVTRLGLETREAVERSFQHEGAHIFLTLARFLEAYGSRFAPSGTVYLATHKKLPKEHCSGTARLHFEQIHSLKEALNLVDLSPAQGLDASDVLGLCLRRVFPALKRPFVDASEHPSFSHIIQKLRQVRDEMPELWLKSRKRGT